MGRGLHRQILIIEDDEALVRLLRAVLHSAGYDVHTMGCGEEALGYISDERPSLVIVDLGLPDMTGYELCKQLRERFRSWALPIVILTGWDKPIDRLRGYAHGANAYLTKPCDPPDLLNAIAFLLSNSRSAPTRN